ncbi:MAG: tyrosine-type recombinase/integrase [Dehalococcoidia bacterium]|nr:tyrosine-type recombinase/integrase [Dehalococcoidia bacterium]
MKREVDAFLDSLSKEKGIANNTTAAYKNDLYQMTEFIEKTGLPKQGSAMWWSQVDQHLFLSYLLTLKDKAYAPTTVARKTAAAKSFFNYLVRRSKMDKSPAENLVSSGLKKRPPLTLTVQEVRRLLAQPAKLTTPEGMRDRSMLEVLYAGGLRVGELVSLNEDDIDCDKGTIRCFGRKDKERVIPMQSRVGDLLRDYMESARLELLEFDDEKALFVNRRGGRLTRQGVWQILKEYAKRAGLSTDVTPHTLRHSLAAHMLSNGASTRTVQELLGHANSSMVQAYAQLVAAHPSAGLQSTSNVTA